jgi:vacuolar-type H+-ATPase subunit E/Vma4
MNEIVNQVFETEAQARKLLDDTRAEIQSLQQASDKEIEEINRRAKEQASKVLQNIIEETRRQVEEDHKKFLADAELDDKNYFIEKNQRISDVVNGIVDYISTPEYLREE